MKKIILLSLLMLSRIAFAQSLPAITASPTNLTVIPGNTATFSVAATGATGYQWRFNGADISGGTNATLSVANAQTANSGYYLAVVKNSTGWVPSQMAYLFLDYTLGVVPSTAGGTLPLTSSNNTYFAGQISGATYFAGTSPPTNGSVQIVAGPQLDQMQPVGTIVAYRSTQTTSKWFNNGYFFAADQSAANNTADKFITTFTPGQQYYYSVICKYTNNGTAYFQPSTVLQLVAGTNGTPAQSNFGLKFPGWIPLEGQDPWLSFPNSPTNQLRVVGESFSLTNSYQGYNDYGTPKFQWRKNGILVGTQQLFTINPNLGTPQGAYGTMILTITNAQPSDAGVYDVDVRGSQWFISQKIYVSIQTANGQGVFQKPKISGTNFICDIVGAVGRNYKVQWSTNLTGWNDLTTLSNVTGTVTFTNMPGTGLSRFYRTVLLP